MNNLNCTQEELAKRMGKSRAYIANLLRLRRLPQEVQQMVSDGKLSGSHVRTLLTLDSDEKILEWAKKTIKEDLSVHQLEELLKNEIKPTKKSKKSKDIYLVDLESSIGDKLKADVELTKHKLTISYKDSQDLNRILEILNLLEEGL